MAKVTGGELVVRCLLKEGIKYVFGIPGGQLCTFLDGISQVGRKNGMDFIMTRHEEAAAHMADAYTRVTGNIGVCTGTVGPGAGNLVSGVATAFDDNIPILVITPQVQSWLSYPSHGSQQELDQLNLFKPITKWSVTVAHYQRIPELIHQAFRLLRTGRPAPVHIEFTVDVLFEAHEESEVLPLISEPENYRPIMPPGPNQELIEEAAKILSEAKIPLIHAGGGVIRSGAVDELIELAEYLSIPISSSLVARSVISSEHPLYLHSLSPGAFMAKNEADVVLAIGCQFDQLEFFGRSPIWGEGQKTIQIDIDPEMIGRNKKVDLGIVGDAKISLKKLLDEVKKITGKRNIQENERLKEYKRQGDAFLKEMEDLTKTKTKNIHPLALVKAVREFFPKDSIVVVDGGNTAIWASYLCKTYEPNTFLWSAGMGQLGVGLPFALGAKLAYPHKQVFIIHGDGSFMLMNQELETARRYNLPVIDIIFNDRSWGMIKAAQDSSFEKRYIGVDFIDVRYDKMAEAMGCYGERVEKLEDVKPALERAVKSGLPAALDVTIDAEVNLAPPHLAMLIGLWLEGCQLPPY